MEQSNTPNFGSLTGTLDSVSNAANASGSLANNIPWLRGTYRQFCRVWAGTGVPQGLDSAGIPNACSPYLADDGRGFGGAGSSPFSGGQCSGAPYTFTYEAFVGSVRVSGPRSESALGPISIRDVPNQFGQELAVFSGDTRVPFTSVSGTEADPPRIQLTNMTRTDGQLDDCGDPDSEFEPGAGYQGEDYGDPFVDTGADGQDRNIVIGPPSIDDSGNISLPVAVDGVNFDVGLPGPSGGDDGLPEVPPLEDGEGIPGDSESGPMDLPDPPPGTICVAIALVVSGFASNEGGISGTAPNERQPGAYGNISVRVLTPTGGSYWQRDVVLRERRTVEAIAVEGLQIDGLRVNVETQLSYVATPIYRRLEEMTDDT